MRRAVLVGPGDGGAYGDCKVGQVEAGDGCLFCPFLADGLFLADGKDSSRRSRCGSALPVAACGNKQNAQRSQRDNEQRVAFSQYLPPKGFAGDASSLVFRLAGA